MSSEDLKLAKASRLIRQRLRLRQADLPTPRHIAQEIEAGRIAHLRVGSVRAHFAALGANASLNIRWNGAALDRLIDEDHAMVVELLANMLPRYGFQVRTEFSFNNFGDRGSIDVLGVAEPTRAVFVGEAKSEWGSLEETLRRQDMKLRLAPKLVRDEFGWEPHSIASVLVFPNLRIARRVADSHTATLARYPARSREIRAWLRRPVGPIGGIWFLTNAATVRHDEAA